VFQVAIRWRACSPNGSRPACRRHRCRGSHPAIAPIIVEALRHVGHVGIRARGTIGGSIAHTDPAAELLMIMVALNPSMT
jgi:carbon-monoxide dehydrogenase medium subunit